jgi:hypothetical protein
MRTAAARPGRTVRLEEGCVVYLLCPSLGCALDSWPWLDVVNVQRVPDDPSWPSSALNRAPLNQQQILSTFHTSTITSAIKPSDNGQCPCTTLNLLQPPSTALSHLPPHHSTPPLLTLLSPQFTKQRISLFTGRRLPARRARSAVCRADGLDGGSGGELHAPAAHARESEPLRRKLCEFSVRVEYEGVLRGFPRGELHDLSLDG